MKQFISYIICLAFIISGCQKITDTPIDVFEGKTFLPTTPGKYIEYRLDSTIYDDFLNTVYTRSYYVKDVMDTSFLDQEGFKANYVLRYERPLADSIYKLKYAYIITDKKNNFEVTDNNLRFVKLIFPITYKGTWEGNKYIKSTNTNDPNNFYMGWLYKYVEYDKPLKLDSLSFDKTLTILQNNVLEGDTSANTPTILTDYSFSREKYARNIGLVEKNVASIKKDFAISDGKRRGFIMRMQAINYN